jgi:hypothetical protein
MEKVKGYTLYSDGIEVLYAQHENGLIETCTRKYSSSFNEKTNVWTEVAEIPEGVGVEYIGKYPLIKGIKKYGVFND